MRIALTTDHAGFEQLKKLQQFLESKGHQCANFGPAVLDSTDDYPDLIAPAAKAVADGQCQMGIIMGGSGQGEAMVANRFKGVRAAVYYGPATAQGAVDADGTAADEDGLDILRLSRQHNDANVLSLAARFLTEAQIEAAVQLWLATPFSGQERHQRRIKKLDEVV
ncbi:MAG: RpiB/LacA/LacB family sugar-phosphate isomerase [Candidatus Saccharimonadales bacterium]